MASLSLYQRQKMMRVSIRCPHCDSRAVVRDSEALSRIVRKIIYMCTNPECGHTYVAHLEIVRTLSSSARPNPLICLPLSKHVRPQQEKP